MERNSPERITIFLHLLSQKILFLIEWHGRLACLSFSINLEKVSAWPSSRKEAQEYRLWRQPVLGSDHGTAV